MKSGLVLKGKEYTHTHTPKGRGWRMARKEREKDGRE